MYIHTLPEYMKEYIRMTNPALMLTLLPTGFKNKSKGIKMAKNHTHIHTHTQ